MIVNLFLRQIARGTWIDDMVAWKTSDPASGTEVSYRHDGTANTGYVSGQVEPLGQSVAGTDPAAHKKRKETLNVMKLWKVAEMLCIVAILLTVLTGSADAQTGRVFKFIGTVIDRSGNPVSGADVTMIPAEGGVNPQPHDVTKTDGRFELSYYMDRPKNWRIYVRAGALGWSPISELFDVLPKYDETFIGRPFVVTSDSDVVDVGAIQVQFWYEKVKIPIRTEGRNLRKEEWQQAWCGVLNKDGKVIGESTVGPRLDKVDLDSSSIIVSLPVGRWKLQFQKFEFPTKL